MTASKIIVTNSQMRDMALSIKESVATEIVGNDRSFKLMSVPFCPVISLYDDIPTNATIARVYVNKVLIAEQSYQVQSAEPWDVLDNRLENNVFRGLVKYFYGLLLENYDLTGEINKVMQEGNSSVTLPNGQTLWSEVRHGAYSRTVGIRQKDTYPVFSLQADKTEQDVRHILSNVAYHWTDPGMLAPADHYIEIPSEAFGE